MIQKLVSGTFFGKNLRSCNVDGFRLSEWEYERAARASRHSHECAYLNMVIRGGHVETLTKGEFACEPAVLVFHPPEEVHGGHIACSDTRIFDLEIAPQRLERLREFGLVPKDRMVLTGALPV